MKFSKYKNLLLIGLVGILVLPVMSIWISKQVKLAKAHDQIISPLADKQDLIRVEPVEPVKNLGYYISLANSFLEKATRLANDNPQQNQVDRLKIVSTLNEALKAANQAISNYTTNPEGYLVRAKIFKRAKRVWPETDNLAERDLTTARSLMARSEKTDQELLTENLPKDDQSPLNFIPTQQANLASNLTIATDNDQQQTKADQQTDNNALSGQDIIPAGQTEVKIQTGLNTNDLVYAVAQDNPENKILSVKAKTDNWFKVGINSPSEQDIIFDYWIISEDKE